MIFKFYVSSFKFQVSLKAIYTEKKSGPLSDEPDFSTPAKLIPYEISDWQVQSDSVKRFTEKNKNPIHCSIYVYSRYKFKHMKWNKNQGEYPIFMREIT